MTCQMAFFATRCFADVTALTLPASPASSPCMTCVLGWWDGARQMFLVWHVCCDHLLHHHLSRLEQTPVNKQNLPASLICLSAANVKQICLALIKLICDKDILSILNNSYTTEKSAWYQTEMHGSPWSVSVLIFTCITLVRVLICWLMACVSQSAVVRQINNIKSMSHSQLSDNN